LKSSLENLDDAIIVALGSNLAGPFESSQVLLDAALAVMGGAGMTVTARSSWWRSQAWPDPSDPPFLNGVALVTSPLSPAQVLAALHGVEAAFGRERHLPNAPRLLDLDLVSYGRLIAHAPVLPHPRAHERRFVMGPLAEIAPAWTHPVSGMSAKALARAAKVGADAAPVRP